MVKINNLQFLLLFFKYFLEIKCKEIIRRLIEENEALKNNQKALMQKVDQYKRDADGFKMVKHFVDEHSSNNNVSDPNCDFTELVIIDASFPTIQIMKYQNDQLKLAKEANEAIITLMESFWESEVYKSKNNSSLRTQFSTAHRAHC